MRISIAHVEADVHVRRVERCSTYSYEAPEAKMKHLTIPIAVALLVSCLISCNSSNQPTAVTPSPVKATAKRYHLTGKVVSVDKQAHMLNVDGEAIPGFMSAMTMPYNVKPESQLDKLSPGDSITADVVLEGDNAWLENTAVTGHGAAPASK
jgi:protein SCO1/2